jgi:periplasmic divalent cation tolerance protein
MTDEKAPVLATISVPGAEAAESIARSLVEKRLAACVQIVDPIRSIYRWQGKIEEETEVLLLLKSRRDLLPSIAGLLDELHPYDVPELIATPIVGGSTAYLSWLQEAVRR